MSVLGALVEKTFDLPKEHLEVHKLALDAMKESQELLAKLGQLRDERDALKEEVKALKEKADRQKELVRAEGVYFRLTADKRSLEEAPYCQVCWENAGTICRMSLYGDKWHCPECLRLERRAAWPEPRVRLMRDGVMSRFRQTGVWQ